MQFIPKSEEELNELFQPGRYIAEVFKAEEKTSKSGNEMIELQLKVYSQNMSETRLVFDYLVDIKSMAYKIKHFCDSCGITKIYESGKLSAENCIGKSCQVVLIIKEDKEGAYPPKNAIKDYVKKVESNQKTVEVPGFGQGTVESNNDDIPF
jgi:hypothetical protein